MIKLSNGLTASLVSDVQPISDDQIGNVDDGGKGCSTEGESDPTDKENNGNTKENESGEVSDEKVVSESSNNEEKEQIKKEEKMVPNHFLVSQFESRTKLNIHLFPDATDYYLKSDYFRQPVASVLKSGASAIHLKYQDWHIF